MIACSITCFNAQSSMGAPMVSLQLLLWKLLRRGATRVAGCGWLTCHPGCGVLSLVDTCRRACEHQVLGSCCLSNPRGSKCWGVVVFRTRETASPGQLRAPAGRRQTSSRAFQTGRVRPGGSDQAGERGRGPGAVEDRLLGPVRAEEDVERAGGRGQPVRAEVAAGVLRLNPQVE
jgi:hypothetical protein